MNLAGVRCDKIHSLSFLLKGYTCICHHCVKQNKDLEFLLSFRDSSGHIVLMYC